MPCSVVVRPEARVAVITCTGHTTGAELLDACRVVTDDPAWEGGFAELWDLLGAPEVDVQPDEITALVAQARRLADRLQPCRVAFVTQREPVALLVRLFELFTLDLGRTYRTFLTREDAAAWLSVPLDAIEA
ncbi:MAG: hypothetical protein AAF845_12590 [Bacteroidota bacterium]